MISQEEKARIDTVFLSIEVFVIIDLNYVLIFSNICHALIVYKHFYMLTHEILGDCDNHRNHNSISKLLLFMRKRYSKHFTGILTHLIFTTKKGS